MSYPLFFTLFLYFFSCNNVALTKLQELPEKRPAYEGFGAVTRGGEGKKVVHVTNLDTKGPGSLREAMGSDRIIVFDVAGVIEGFKYETTDLVNLTIDGSSAPAPGITINYNGNGSCIEFYGEGCHDIIVTNLRFRGHTGLDHITITKGSYNIMVDRCSFMGSNDGALDITAGSHDVTVQWCIFGPPTSESSGPMLIAYTPTRNISIHHNLFNSRGVGTEGARNPLVHSSNGPSTAMIADIRNNIIWNWGNSKTDPCCGFGYGTSLDYGGTANIINNFYQTDGNQAATAIDFNHNGKGAMGYLAGNVCGNKEVNVNELSNHAMWPIPPNGAVTTDDACVAARKVLALAGPRPIDAIDSAFLHSVVLTNCQ